MTPASFPSGPCLQYSSEMREPTNSADAAGCEHKTSGTGAMRLPLLLLRITSYVYSRRLAQRDLIWTLVGWCKSWTPAVAVATATQYGQTQHTLPLAAPLPAGHLLASRKRCWAGCWQP